MAAQANARPIIKRKKVVKGGGHHGGAWKVAYADFVTAMMAFFMLMWLLGATTEKQRKGIADYFNPTIPINRISGGGEGAFGGDSVFSEDTMAQSGTGAGLNRPTEERRARGATGTEARQGEDAGAQAAKEVVDSALLAMSGDSTIRDLIRRHIVTRVSDQGLVIELFDRADAPLFEDDDSAPRPELTVSDASDIGALRSADTWRLWRDGRIREHNAAAARLMPERETRRAVAARATGRLEVLRKLGDRF